MTCASCASRIEKRLNELDGVEASVNFATEQASVSFDPDRVEPDQLLGAVESAGYGPSCRAPLGTLEPTRTRGDAELADWRRRLIVSAVLSVPLFAMAMIPPLQFDYWQWLSLQLATPVVLWAAWPFHRAAWQNLQARRGDHGHADLARHPRRLRLVGRRALLPAAPARPGCR